LSISQGGLLVRLKEEELSIDFDRVIDRAGTNSTKWTRHAGKSSRMDVIPAWVADMDFAAPTPVIEALRARIDHGIYGYSTEPDALREVVVDRMARLYGWEVKPSWMVMLPGVVSGVFHSCRCTGESGDEVLVPTPIYHPFLEAPSYQDRTLVPAPATPVDGKWQFDLDRFKRAVSARTCAFLLCNPYNPVGRTLSRAELEALAEICLSNDILICSDEIHCELLLDEDKPHIPTATLGPEVADKTITLISTSKTFNLAGLGGFAIAVIPNARLRLKFEALMRGVTQRPGAPAYASALVAYRDCDDWLEEMLTYLRRNRDLVEQEVASIPGLSMTHVESTYLAWINVAQLGLEKPWDAFVEGGVALQDGQEMDDPNYLRLNFATQQSTLQEILRRIRFVAEKAMA